MPHKQKPGFAAFPNYSFGTFSGCFRDVWAFVPDPENIPTRFSAWPDKHLSPETLEKSIPNGRDMGNRDAVNAALNAYISKCCA
jgi:hypothetical protein